MLGIGWSELIIIGIVLLVFVGPKNLPPLLRKVGSVIAELKGASRELRNQLDVEVQALSKELEPSRKMVRELSAEALKRAAAPYEELQEAEKKFREDLNRALKPEDVLYAEAAAKAAQSGLEDDADPEPDDDTGGAQAQLPIAGETLSSETSPKVEPNVNKEEESH